MGGLTDMEELLSEISNKEFVDYMREAIACYNGGAYRGCIVMSYIALFDDIREKLGELAKVNRDAKKIWQDVEKRVGDQEVFESYMADQLKSKGLLEEKKYQRLNLVRDLRNKAAHPSGVHATAEEARFVFQVVIREFLGESLLKTTHAVDALVGDLKSSNLFPTQKISDTKEIVEDELSKLHEKALPYLIAQLLNARESSDNTTCQNADRFLVGMASMGSGEVRVLLRKMVIIKCCVDDDNAKFIGRMISADANLLDCLAKKDHARVCKLLVKHAKVSKSGLTSNYAHPARQMKSLASGFEEDFILENYEDFFSELLTQNPYTPMFFNSLQGKGKLVDRLLEKWKSNAGSSTFEVANKFAGSIEEIDLAVGKLLDEQASLEITVAVMEAADWGAFEAKSLVKSKFSDAPKLVAATKQFIADRETEAESIIASSSVTGSLEDFVAAALEE
ncbi:hypothetical protein [Ruegeria arenilitoris]|uniref:hypothetical protein n=1 Tax=Ruegeria arenilitoris TaxID=1173585 RepID=UPI00147B0D48|nr:hypothetical protein [Ruegeria arenilitoris]